MILWLDHKLFGNGHGMASPCCDGRFHWLVDTRQPKARRHGRGQLYSFSTGLGAQLASTQWFHPRPGECRILADRTFRVFHSRRRWLRVYVSWAMTDLPEDLTAALTEIRAFGESVGTLFPPSKIERANANKHLTETVRWRKALEYIAAPAIFFLSEDATRMRDTARAALDGDRHGQ